MKRESNDIQTVAPVGSRLVNLVVAKSHTRVLPVPLPGPEDLLGLVLLYVVQRMTQSSDFFGLEFTIGWTHSQVAGDG